MRGVRNLNPLPGAMKTVDVARFTSALLALGAARVAAHVTEDGEELPPFEQRTFDGTNNSQVWPLWGTVNTPQVRYFPFFPRGGSVRLAVSRSGVGCSSGVFGLLPPAPQTIDRSGRNSHMRQQRERGLILAA